MYATSQFFINAEANQTMVMEKFDEGNMKKVSKADDDDKNGPGNDRKGPGNDDDGPGNGDDGPGKDDDSPNTL